MCVRACACARALACVSKDATEFSDTLRQCLLIRFVVAVLRDTTSEGPVCNVLQRQANHDMLEQDLCQRRSEQYTLRCRKHSATSEPRSLATWISWSCQATHVFVS